MGHKKKKDLGVHFDPFNRPKKSNQTISRHEVSFSEDSRREFITGFSKRKKQRQKIAKDALAELAKSDRIAARKMRKEHMLAALETMNGVGVDIDPDIVYDPTAQKKGEKDGKDDELSSLDESEGREMGPAPMPEGFEYIGSDDEEDNEPKLTSANELVYENAEQKVTATITPLEGLSAKPEMESSADEEDDGEEVEKIKAFNPKKDYRKMVQQSHQQSKKRKWKGGKKAFNKGGDRSKRRRKQ